MADLRPGLAAVVAAVTLVVLACGDGGSGGEGRVLDGDGTVPELQARSGGMTTTFDVSPRALSIASLNINHEERQIFADGKVLFEAAREADAAAEFGGLGPHYDATSCAGCHAHDGRAAGPTGAGPLPVGFIAKVATDDAVVRAAVGTQLTRQADGTAPEATVSVTYEERPGRFADGTPYSLRAPRYAVELTEGVLPGTTVLPDATVLMVRVAPHLSGLGLLELVPEEEIAGRADPEDSDGDGVSGRLGRAVDLLTGQPVLGRFGWNGQQPSVEQQAAVALFDDLGLGSRYFPGSGADPEVTDDELSELRVYTQALAVPGVRDLHDPEVQRGWELFHEVGCARCHAGPYTTGQGPIQGLSHQAIHPFTDLLTHDMGDGLADRTMGGGVVPTEWRTPPLWGIGMIETVNGHSDLLHDGRARDLSEAVLWHGGEAASSTAAYREMVAADRTALIRFLESL